MTGGEGGEGEKGEMGESYWWLIRVEGGRGPWRLMSRRVRRVEIKVGLF